MRTTPNSPEMANGTAGLVPLLVYFGAVVISIPASLLAYGLGRYFDSTGTAIRYVGAGLLGLILAAGTALAAFVDPVAGLTLVVVGAGGALVLAGFPLYIGRQLIERWTDLPADHALEYAVLGLPVGLVASFAVFLAPGGPARFNLTFLDGPVAALAWTVVGLVVTLGPGAVGFGMYRLVARLDRADKTY